MKTRGLAIITLSLLLPKIALACGCDPYARTALDAYQDSDLVVIARMLSVEKAIKPESRVNGDISAATMIVEKVYKGTVQIGEQLKFAQGDEVLHCTWSFYREEIGERFLLYLVQPEKPSDPLYVWNCNRSTGIESAREDLLFLDNYEQHRGRTRVSGVLRADGDLDISGRNIRIIGRNKTYIANTDKDGVYEIYNLPAGRYVIEPELPFGWQVDQFLATREPTRPYVHRRPSNRLAFRLQPRKHFSAVIELRLSNHVSGTVLDTQSRPLDSVCVSLVPIKDQSLLECNVFTDKKGRFQIESVEAGAYLLIFNHKNKLTREMPFPRLYYPGVIERKDARTLDVKHGQSLDGLNVAVTRDPTFVPE